MTSSITQNDLYELVADFGVFLCTALRRDHYLTRMIDEPGNFLSLADTLGHERATVLKNHPERATDSEVKALIEKQIRDALEAQDPEITPAIWLCESDNGNITLIEGWGEDLKSYLRFRVIGHYDSRNDALDDLHRLYFTTLLDQ
jgi:hypothetical protein